MKKKIAFYFGCSMLVLLLFFYLAGASYFSTVFMPKTIINSVDYGNQTGKIVLDQLEAPLSTTLSLYGKNGENEYLSVDAIHYRRVVNPEQVSAIFKKQNPFLWPFVIWWEKNYDLSFHVEYDQDTLLNQLKSLSIFSSPDIIPPKNASIMKNDGGQYQIVKEVEGNQLDLNAVEQAITEALIQEETSIDLSQKGCYLRPTITSSSPQLEKSLNQLNALQTVSFTYQFGSQMEVLDFSTFSNWIAVTQTGEISFSKEQVRAYISELSHKYNTLKNTRQFMTSRHGILPVSGGIYGWKINVEESTAALLEALYAGIPQTLEPIYTSAARSREPNDIGSTYIEVDLTEQHLWFYIDGTLFIETDIVSGLPIDERETPTGVFSVWNKETKRYLTGENYKLWVEFWMPIDWTGVGIHDASWQSKFGGETYLRKGSHGCLNTPFAACKAIFDRVEIGTPVVIYRSPIPGAPPLEQGQLPS